MGTATALVVVALVATFAGASVSAGTTAAEGGLQPSDPYVYVEDQRVDGTAQIVVGNATLPEGGFLALYRGTNRSGEFVGVTDYLEGGYLGEVEVPFEDRYYYADSGTPHVVVAIRDSDDDREFDRRVGELVPQDDATFESGNGRARDTFAMEIVTPTPPEDTPTRSRTPEGGGVDDDPTGTTAPAGTTAAAETTAAPGVGDDDEPPGENQLTADGGGGGSPPLWLLGAGLLALIAVGAGLGRRGGTAAPETRPDDAPDPEAVLRRLQDLHQRRAGPVDGEALAAGFDHGRQSIYNTLDRLKRKGRVKYQSGPNGGYEPIGTVPTATVTDGSPPDGSASDAGRIERLLAEHSGRMKQSQVVSETGWSSEKVSQVVSGMVEDGRVEELRIGRETLLTLPDDTDATVADDTDPGSTDETDATDVDDTNGGDDAGTSPADDAGTDSVDEAGAGSMDDVGTDRSDEGSETGAGDDAPAGTGQRGTAAPEPSPVDESGSGGVGGSDWRAMVPDRVPGGPDVDIAYDDLDVGEFIGGGGNADVHRATVDTATGPATVAIKRPRARGTLHAEQVERFVDEAETWARLDDHDGVVDVLGWGSAPMPWLAMEYMDGGDLAARAGEVDLAEGLWTAVSLAQAVRHAHRRGIAHLDLKPANVLFRECEGAWDAPKVADWGLSKHLIEHSASVEGMTPHYAAPEQFDDDYGSADDITDVYGLGAVCYELFTGRPPYEGRATEVMNAVLHERPPAPSTVADLPPALDDVLLTALATEKADRYESVLYLRDDLQAILDDY